MRQLNTALYILFTTFLTSVLGNSIQQHVDALTKNTHMKVCGYNACQPSPCFSHACCLCGTIPYTTDYATPDPIITGSQVWSFISEPNLHPMKITVNTNLPGTSPGLICVAPYAFSSNAIYGQPGSLILNNTGDPIWFRPLKSPNLMNTDFRVQTLYGNPVLTFWQGTLATPPAYTNLPAASPEPGACYYILDSTYKVIKNVTAQNGYTPDIHEFLLTPQNTALLLSTQPVAMDLTPYGGPQNGYVNDFAVQEIDLKTNTLLFFWSALDHIPLSDSYEPASTAIESNNIWDAYHLNSIGLTDSIDDILISSRNTWAIYRINKPTQNIIWRLGGKQSNFTIDSDAQFSWQHDARFFANNIVSLFDDNCCESQAVPPGTPPSHGLVLQLNLSNMTASRQKTYYHDPLLNVGSQGNVQSLDNGNTFIGWGESPYFSEYLDAGNTESNPSLNVVYDAQMPGNNYTYRAYRNNWVGTPCYPPSIAVQSNQGQNTIYASWNGSTETTSWQLLSGSYPCNLAPVVVTGKTGFETAITTTNPGPFFQVQALNAQGNVIGVSQVISLNSNGCFGSKKN